VLISATTEEVLEWIGEGLRLGAVAFPGEIGAFGWPRPSIEELLKIMPISI
jgi:hypothetical protein